MNERVAVDVGNTRIKWGLERDGALRATAAVPYAEPAAWQRQVEAWGVAPDAVWLVSGVQPRRRDELCAWLDERGARVHRLESFRDVPLAVEVDRPESVGIDRLLDAVAAKRRGPAGTPALIVDAGSAVTVNYVDAAGTFRGGAIFPGLRLMAKALHDYTALLPLVEVGQVKQALATNTLDALQSGIYHAVVGGIERLHAELRRAAEAAPILYLTGGDAALVAQGLSCPATLWPEMTLEGILFSV